MDAIRVLIVDDEVELVETLVERLELRGYEPAGVHTGDEAVDRVKTEPYDVVVLDVKLRGESGVDVMKRIKQIKPDLPVLLLTGHMSQETSEECLKAGALDYLIKPIQIDRLIEKLNEAIRLYRP